VQRMNVQVSLGVDRACLSPDYEGTPMVDQHWLTRRSQGLTIHVGTFAYIDLKRSDCILGPVTPEASTATHPTRKDRDGGSGAY
jgi:hypothetical protein